MKSGITLKPVIVLLVSMACFICLLPDSRAQEEQPKDISILLLEQERKYEKEQAEYVQKNILDKILGEGKSSVVVDVEFELRTTKTLQQAKESKAEGKRKLGEIDYILPGIPNPKTISQPEAPPAESKSESGQRQEGTILTQLAIRKQSVTVLHDEMISKERLKIVEVPIAAALNFNTRRGDKVTFQSAKFNVPFIPWKQFLQPKYILPLFLAVLLIFFLFGPLASFLKNYLKTLRERGGTEVTVDSKLEGGSGAGGPGGPGPGGAFAEAELEAKKKKEEEEEEKKYKPFRYIDDENLRRLVYLISKEPASTIALVLSYLKPEYVREVLVSLPEGLQAESAINLATVRQMTPEQVMDIDNDIKKKIDFLIGGVDQLLKVIAEVDRITRDNILEYLKNEKPELYKKVRKHVFIFDDIVSVPDQAMQTIIRELKIENIARALRSADQDITNKFFSNMSPGAVSLVKEEMEYGKPLTPDQVEEEKSKIIDTIKRLENEGKIFIREKTRLVVEGVEESPDKARLDEYFSYGTGLYDEGRYEEAIPYFQYCLQVDPGNASVYQYLGNTYYTLGRFDEALANFGEAVELNPGDEELKSFVEQLKANVVQQA